MRHRGGGRWHPRTRGRPRDHGPAARRPDLPARGRGPACRPPDLPHSRGRSTPGSTTSPVRSGRSSASKVPRPHRLLRREGAPLAGQRQADRRHEGGRDSDGSTSSNAGAGQNGVPGLVRVGRRRNRGDRTSRQRTLRPPLPGHRDNRLRPGRRILRRGLRSCRRHDPPLFTGDRETGPHGLAQDTDRDRRLRPGGLLCRTPVGPACPMALAAANEPRIVPIRGGYLKVKRRPAGNGPRQRLPGARPGAAVPRRPPDPRPSTGRC